MCGLIRKITVFTALSAAALAAQSIGYGVRGGIPLSDFWKAESRTGALTNIVKGRGDVVIGPMLEVRLPLGLGIEFDALYRRWNAEGVLNPGSASTWEYPLYGKFRVPGIIVRPYAGAGINFQHLGDVGKFLGGTSVDKNRRGFLGAAGLEFKVPKVRISPEVRFTRWSNSGPIRATNQVDFLIGLSF
jgi:opacity protein-like surface antigen